jgi:hypothetical protein
VLGEALLKDTVLLGAALLTAAESLRDARTGGDRPGGGPGDGISRPPSGRTRGG